MNKLKQPFVGYYPISQKFGENLNNFYAQEGFKGHEGLDLGLPMGTQVLSAMNGKVITKSTDAKRGEGVYILSSDLYQWNGQDCYFIAVYWHMMDGKIEVKVGDTVKAGDLLGLSNNTGNTTGPHLHFGILPVATDGSTRHLAAGNGYGDCIDPLPYLELTAAPSRILKLTKPYMHGSDVLGLQRILNILPEDGIFGSLTEAVVKIFQKAQGLKADGVVGPQTWAKLN